MARKKDEAPKPRGASPALARAKGEVEELREKLRKRTAEYRAAVKAGALDNVLSVGIGAAGGVVGAKLRQLITNDEYADKVPDAIRENAELAVAGVGAAVALFVPMREAQLAGVGIAAYGVGAFMDRRHAREAAGVMKGVTVAPLAQQPPPVQLEGTRYAGGRPPMAYRARPMVGLGCPAPEPQPQPRTGSELPAGRLALAPPA